MSPARYAWATAFVVAGLLGLFVSATNAGGAREVWRATAWLGAPLAAAGAIIAYRVTAALDGADLADRLLCLTTGHTEEWPRAMRAELASIDDPRERRRFAFGCVLTAFRVGIGRTHG